MNTKDVTKLKNGSEIPTTLHIMIVYFSPHWQALHDLLECFPSPPSAEVWSIFLKQI